MAQLTINGIEYEVIFVDVNGIPRVRLYNSASDEYTDLLPGGSNKTFVLPPGYANPGVVGLLVCDEDGNITIQNPTQYLADMALTETLMQTQLKINAILTALRNANIFAQSITTITPSPVTLAVDVANNQTITPSPATTALETR